MQNDSGPPPTAFKADKDVNRIYDALHLRYGDERAEANGYLLHSLFEKEQRILLRILKNKPGLILDIACGSGLMLQSLIEQGRPVYGIDYNKAACQKAKSNNISVVRGDAFNLPFSDNTFDQAVNCQLLSTMTTEQAQALILEAARVLKPCGHLVILWRHAQSLLQITAHTTLAVVNRLIGKPVFQQYTHPLAEVKAFAWSIGMSIENEAVSLPFLWPDTVPASSIRAQVIGKSLIVVLRKSQSVNHDSP